MNIKYADSENEKLKNLFFTHTHASKGNMGAR
jgi:hypothetical protein